MRIVVLSSQNAGFASYCLPTLAKLPGVDVAGVILNEGVVTRPWRRRWKNLLKLARIGPLGAFNGVRMRRWYGDDLHALLPMPPLEPLAAELNVPYFRTPSLLDQKTVDLVQGFGADLGLSLGNGYIPERVFSIPRLGMLNIHHELLPEFQGAISVMWQIYFGSRTTGYTIHKIDRRIDTGDILLRREVPIDLQPTLGQTVTRTTAKVMEASLAGLGELLTNYDRFEREARPQGLGRRFTTPTYWQYRRMLRRHGQMRAHRPE
jgi:methionyl-tRNA formyltransferase